MSGVMGHKPSFGIVPTHGQIPGPPGTLTLADLAVGGPMARSVGDLELALDLLVGPNRWDAPAWRVELPPSRVSGLEGCRVAAWLDDERCPVDPEVKVLLEGAAVALAGSGAVVDTDARPDFTLAKAADTFLTLLHAALAGSFTPRPDRAAGRRHRRLAPRRHAPAHRRSGTATGSAPTSDGCRCACGSRSSSTPGTSSSCR